MPDQKNSGLSENTIGAIAYITIVPAIFFLAIAPYNKSAYVRFHAWQSTMLSIVAFLLYTVLSYFPCLNLHYSIIVVKGLCLPILFVWAFLSIYLIMKAMNGKKLRLPLLGAWAEKQSNR
jgi:uncharacterized membrane protein